MYLSLISSNKVVEKNKKLEEERNRKALEALNSLNKYQEENKKFMYDGYKNVPEKFKYERMILESKQKPEKEKPKMVLFTDRTAPINPIHKGIVDEEESSQGEETSEADLSDIANTSLPSHISEIEPPEDFDIDEYIRTVRNKYRKLNNQSLIEKQEADEEFKEDPTQYPLYVRLNKLRKMREANLKKEKKKKMTSREKFIHNRFDKFDKLTRKMIRDKLDMNHPNNYEGIYFKTHDEYVKYMKSKYTTKIDTIDIDSLHENLGCTYPRYSRDTSTKLIKSLRVTADEYKGFEKYKLSLKEKGYIDQEIDLYEYTIESRLKEILYQAQLNPNTSFEEKERERNITWKQLTALKQSVAYFLQTQAHRPIGDRNYDIKDYHEPDPRMKYDAYKPKFYKESKQTSYSLINKLNDVIDVLRDVCPSSKMVDKLEYANESYFAILRHKVPPNTREEQNRIPKFT